MTLRSELARIRQQLEGDLPTALRGELESIRSQLDALRAGQKALETSVAQFHEETSSILQGGSSHHASESMPVANVLSELGQADPASVYPEFSQTVGPRRSSKRKCVGLVDQVKQRRTKRLEDLLVMAEGDEKARNLHKQKDAAAAFLGRVMKDKHSFEVALDSAVAVIIVANSLFLAIEIDLRSDVEMDGWFIANLLFALLFWLELTIKVYLHGFCGQFCGEGRLGNIFDASLVLLDTLQFLGQIIGGDAGQVADQGVSLSLFRMIRLVRLVRIMRLIRTDRFKDVFILIQGLLNGLKTLGWSTIVFFMIVYVISLVCRETLGERDGVRDVAEYFNSVPVALFTVFRCTFSDCTSASGTPIFWWVTKSYGGAYGLIYCIFMFFVTVGVFNVIAAIFVEASVQAAGEQSLQKLHARLNDPLRWAVNVKTLVSMMIAHSDSEMPVRLSDSLHSVLKIEVTRDKMNDLIRDEHAAIEALNALDIDPNDHGRLADIIDADRSGTVDVLEFVHGLRMMRGPPRRSDIVCVDLMVRDLQEKVSDLDEKIGDVMKMLAELSPKRATQLPR